MLTNATRVAAIAEVRADEPYVKLLLSILESVPGLIAYWDRNLVCRYANAAYSNWFGTHSCTLIGASSRDLLNHDSFAEDFPYMQAALTGQSVRFERSIRKADLTEAIIVVQYCPDYALDGMVRGFSVFTADVTDLKRAQRELEWSARVIEASKKAVVVANEGGIIMSVNACCVRLTGYAAAELVGTSVNRLAREDEEALFETLLKRRLDHGTWHGALTIRNKTGDMVPCEASFSLVKGRDHHDVTRLVLAFEDVSDKLAHEQALQRLATRDALTDLDNRFSLVHQMAQFLADADARGEICAAFFIDLDDFKTVNDTFGHEAGDAVLRHVASCLTESVRKSDVVARLGGDEFVVLLNNLAGKATIEEIARRISSRIQQPVELDGHSYNPSASIGIAIRQPDGLTADALIGLADSAMYRAKRSGKNRIQFIDADACD